MLVEEEVRTLQELADRLAKKGLAEEQALLLGVLRDAGGRREITVSEAAQIAHRTSQTIRNWIKAGWLPARADEANRYYVPIDALLPLLQLRAYRPEPPAHLAAMAGDEIESAIHAVIDEVRARSRGDLSA